MVNKIKKYSLLLLLLFVSVSAGLFFSPKLPLLKTISFSQAVYDDKHHLLRLTLSDDEKYRLYTPLSQIPPQLIEATLLQEDQYFYWHFGVNPFATLKAIWQTYVIQSRRMGASTLTMQLARIHFGIHSKTWLGKCLQIIYALRLEMHYNKQQILEAYLNLAPYGNNIEGVGSASVIYFGKPVGQLTLPEILTLSVIPQNPKERVSQPNKLKESRRKLFLRWLIQHPEDLNKQALMQLPLQMQNLRALPFHAPHFVNNVLLDSAPDEYHVETTLDLSLQKVIEQVTHHYLARKNQLGVYNAAVLLVDTRDLSIKGLLGSAKFLNTSIAGQLDGTLIRRSPGSTLKPFIYGLALDQGLIHPNTMLKDVPRSFGSYNPENFDYDFIGPVKARDALVLSRNIPAIHLAEQLSQPRLYEFLEQANIHHLKPEAYYGLALVLGGAELSMQELASLYTMLANDGIWHPLRKFKNEIIAPGKRLLSPEASFLILDMLQETPRSDFNYQPGNMQQMPVAWKTGTSSGYRDAWSVGVFGPYVLIVWLGNFDNHGNPALVGRSMAAPLLFELIHAIISQTAPISISPKNPNHLNLTQVAVCKASGMLPTRYCLDTELTWFIPGKSPIKTDTIYREVPVDKNTGLRVCHFDKNTRFDIYEFWPSDLRKIFRQAGIQRRTPPPYDSRCTSNLLTESGLAPQITSPQSGLKYVMQNNLIQKTTIPFMATVDADVTTLYWFVNENFLGTTHNDQPFLWKAKSGKFIVRVVDDYGRSDARDVSVTHISDITAAVRQ